MYRNKEEIKKNRRIKKFKIEFLERDMKNRILHYLQKDKSVLIDKRDNRRVIKIIKFNLK